MRLRSVVYPFSAREDNLRRKTLTTAVYLATVLLILAAFSRPGSAQKKVSHGQAEMQARKLWSIADAQRRKKKYKNAVKAYRRSLEILSQSGDDKTTLGMGAKQMIELCEAMPMTPKQCADGDYEAKAWGYFSEMKIKIRIKGGKLRNFWILENKETRKAALAKVPRYIYRKQSPSVDAVTGATITSYGLMTATMRALQKAKKPAEETDTKKPVED